MHARILRTAGFVMFISLIMPAGRLFAIKIGRTFGISSKAANWADTEKAAHLLNQMQTLALKASKQVGPLRVQEVQLNWQEQASRLGNAKWDINRIGADLLRLGRMKKELEPWQQSLAAKVTPDVHEMVYQMDQAIRDVKTDQSSVVLAMGEYPQTINMIHQQADRMAGTIGTVTRYASAAQRLAVLEGRTASPRS